MSKNSDWYKTRVYTKPYDPDDHLHTKGDGSWWEYDARGIEIARVCDVCKPHKLKGYRPEVLTDPNYDHDEPIEPDWSEAEDNVVREGWPDRVGE